jgi:hypothetical protein
MSTDEPPRWRESRPEGLDLDLGDVDAALGGYDLDALRARTFASGAPQPSPPARTPPRRWRWKAASAAGASGALALLWWWWTPPAAVAPPPRPPDQVAPARLDLAPTVVAPPVLAPVESPRPTPRTSRPALPAEVASETAVPAPILEVLPADPPAGPPTGHLGEELRAFLAAETALDEGDPQGALAAADVYLATWPGGRLVDEAALLRLAALIGLDRWAEAEALALALGERPGLAPKQAEILQFRLEALLGLGRCDQALPLAESLGRRAVASARRACRPGDLR